MHQNTNIIKGTRLLNGCLTTHLRFLNEQYTFCYVKYSRNKIGSGVDIEGA